MSEENKFVFTISCEPKFNKFNVDEISTSFVERISTIRIQQINEGVLKQLKKFGEEHNITTFVAIDESKVSNMYKKAEAFDIIKKYFSVDNYGYCKISKRWFIDIGNRRYYFDTQEEYDLLKEVLIHEIH